MKVRKATITEFDGIMEIYRYAREYMIWSGNPGQWGHFYPDSELVKDDIWGEKCMVICNGKTIHVADGSPRIIYRFQRSTPHVQTI